MSSLKRLVDDAKASKLDYKPAQDFSSEDLQDDEAASLAELFRALGDASRIRILAAITARELNVGAIAEIAQISESAVSHHLRGLRQMRLVRARKEGREVYYALDDEHVAELFQRGLEHVRHG
jgi:DNA-binding transcriptional ArsR family regulator